MPKAGKNSKLHRVARRVAAASPLPVSAAVSKPQAPKDGESDTPATQNLSRGQRKRNAKREQYLRKEKLILSSLKVKRQEDQKKRIDGLDAIRDALLNTVSNTVSNESAEPSDGPAPSYNTNKSKRRLVPEEVHHMNLVLQHPSFQADPFATIQEHLQNTLAEQRKTLEQKSKEKMQQAQEKTEEQKRLKKERLQGVKKSRKRHKPGRTKS